MIDGENPAFFLLPTRAWQFGLGAFIFFLNSKNNFINPTIQNGILILSLFFLINGMFVSNNNIGDEIKYVLDRQKRDNQMGNTLDRPSMLIKKNFV